MGQLCKLVLFILVLMAVLHNSSGGTKGFQKGKNTPSKKPSNKPSQETKTQPNYPRQPSYPGAGGNPSYPNQQYPGRGGSIPGGYPNQNPGAGSYTAGGSYPSAGGSPNQYPGRGSSNPGGYPKQNPGGGSYPAGGSYPSAGGSPSQYPGRGSSNPGGYPNQNPGAGSYPAGGSYPSAGGSPNQYPGKGSSNPGGYPNQNPGAGTYPAGGNPNQYPGRGGVSPGGYPNQNPGAGTYPAGGNPNQYPGRGVNPGGYPNQNPGAGGFSNQYPGRSGYSPGGYPAAGSYPVRTAGQPGGYPGGHPSAGGGYPNWNPNNKILSPRYGGSFGGGGFGTGGSPFSQTVKGRGYGPSVQSKGFAKKAMLAAGVGAMAGMAVGYGIGNFPRPNFQFRSPQEERHYNNYMYNRPDTHSKGGNNKGGTSYTSKLPPQAQSYDQFMNTCMKRSDLLKEQNMEDSAVRNNIQRDEPLIDYPGMNEDYLEKVEPKNNTILPTTDYPKDAGIHKDEDKDTVSIVQIGYPALIEQMIARKCVELYLIYSESFQDKQNESWKEKKQEKKALRSSSNHNCNHSRISEVLLFLTTSFMLLRGT
ncbi:prion protein b [Rhinichthys klamathensis goyatoka]|uniref:prion protein b n=1 Tax=Rhinichthys klamathensis goyatoka TaxID=3034132 RepID=UPI0024B4D15E|nr:prion protein b [Rhinichthys klamathensis goyatoka]